MDNDEAMKQLFKEFAEKSDLVPLGRQIDEEMGTQDALPLICLSHFRTSPNVDNDEYCERIVGKKLCVRCLGSGLEFRQITRWERLDWTFPSVCDPLMRTIFAVPEMSPGEIMSRNSNGVPVIHSPA